MGGRSRRWGIVIRHQVLAARLLGVSLYPSLWSEEDHAGGAQVLPVSPQRLRKSCPGFHGILGRVSVNHCS